MRISHILIAAMIGAVALLPSPGAILLAQDATPASTASCENAATPAAMDATKAGMEMGTPMAGKDHMAMELDLLYIDMMIPHHASIVAMAQAALPRLMDERLQAMAQSIIDAQSAEIEDLRGYRETFYGEAEAMPMDAGMMAAMDEMMPAMSSPMKEMAFQMDAAAQVAAVCAAKDTDLAFIDLTIPHHQMAIEASETAIEEAAHEEIRAFAQRVIEDQQREIEELEMIHADLTGDGTPASS